MLIEEIFPQVVGAKSTLRACLVVEAASAQLSNAQIEEVLKDVPATLLAAECFFDLMTGMWRYEFGLPYHVNNNQSLFWGTHMWVPVKHLWAALACANRMLPDSQRISYLQRLAADPG